jgi:hypothetical protein
VDAAAFVVGRPVVSGAELKPGGDMGNEGQMLTEAAWRRHRDKQISRLEKQRNACLAAAKTDGPNASALRGLARDLRRQIELLRY